jgi:hypothetical protein
MTLRAMPPEVVADELDLSDVGSDAFDFCVQGCSRLANAGIAEGLDWLVGAGLRSKLRHRGGGRRARGSDRSL